MPASPHHDEPSRKPRVLIVTTWFPTEESPMVGSFVERDIRALSTVANIQVLHLVSPSLDDGKRSFTQAGVQIRRLVMNLKNPANIIQARAAVAELAKNADIVHSMAVSSAVAIPIQRIACPWVHTEHWSGFLAWNTGWRSTVRWAMGRLLRKATRLVAVSDLLGDAMRAVLSHPVEVIPNQVDAPTSPRPRSGDELITGRTVNMVGVGNLVASKRPSLAIGALAELQARGWHARLTWYGDGPLREELQKEAAERGIDAVFPGAIAPSEVPVALASQDLFILPTEYETFCLAAAEALSVGRPVVIGDRGGHRAFVAPDIGVLVPGANAADYADAVETALAATRHLSADDFGHGIRARYSPKVFTRHYDELYRTVLGEWEAKK